ncbi:MAG: hypothetical protein ABGX00_16070 [Allomuricauda sp.]
MFKNIILSLLVIFLNIYMTQAQETIASEKMQIKEYESTFTIPLLDHEDNMHILAISSNILTDKNLIHIKYDSSSGSIKHQKIGNPPEHTVKEVVGHRVTTDNNIELFFHKKGINEFTVYSVGDEPAKARLVNLKLKKEKVVQYISDQNEFIMLTVQRNSSILNLYTFNGESFEVQKFDLTNERFYDDESKRVPLSELFAGITTTTIIPDLPNNAMTYGKKIKIYPNKEIITITFNNNKNGTRIVHLNRSNGNAATDFVPLPTQKFADNISLSLKTNAYILDNTIYSLVFSKSLMVLDITDLASKQSINQLEFSPDEEITFLSSKTSEVPIGPVSITSSTTKEKTKDAKVFFRNLKASYYTGLYAENAGEDIVIKIGGYTPPSSGGPGFFMPGTSTASMDGNGNVSISSTPPMYMGNSGFSRSSGELEKHLLLSSNTYQIISKDYYENIYDRVDEFNKDTKTVQFETVVNTGSEYLYGYYDEKEETFYIVKFKK